MSTQPLLIEIGAEEMPAGVSRRLLQALEDNIRDLLVEHDIDTADGQWHTGCTPRRLLLHWNHCPTRQPDRDETLWGPPERVAYDAEGKATRAAEGFAKKAGLALGAFTLDEKGDGKGRYLKAIVHRQGREVVDILGEALPGILRKLPSPKQMRWQNGSARDDAFIRPVRWIVARLGESVIPFEFAGVSAGKISHGHRVYGQPAEMDIDDPFGWLYNEQEVCARIDGPAPAEAERDMRKALQEAGSGHSSEQEAMALAASLIGRRARIESDIDALLQQAGLELVPDDELIDEVTDLTEWPTPVLCEFDTDFLRLPEEAIRITLKSHQRCFITREANGAIANRFIAVANIAPEDMSKIADGNARVVNARLADAAFYFDRDPKESLDARVEKLNEVTFQEGLGMVGDQVRRLRGFVLDNAGTIGANAETAQRAAYLCKSDLTTGLVYEFPELQGYMGGVYARMQSESGELADAIAEHYRPVGADDALPASPEARLIAIAERIDKLLGYFHLGKIPTASADPFGLRRAAIGLIRLLTDQAMPVDLTLAQVIDQAAKQWNEQRVTIAISPETRQAVTAFVHERLLGLAGTLHASRAGLDAALGAAVERPLYQHLQVARLLGGFADSETGQAVAAANKRIANILKKSDEAGGEVNASGLQETAEQVLFDALRKAETDFPPEPEAQLDLLAELREPVDRFFDDVMVMAEDEQVRRNRLALLARLRGLFLRLADVSRL